MLSQPIVVKGKNCSMYFPRWRRLMKEKITRKVEKACRGPHTSVKGRVCHSSRVSEREATPSGDINNCSRLYKPKYASGYFRLEERCSFGNMEVIVKIIFQRRNNFNILIFLLAPSILANLRLHRRLRLTIFHVKIFFKSITMKALLIQV